MSTARDKARLVTEVAGLPDAPALEEALTRTFARNSWSDLKQADFDGIQDAFDDAAGRPRRKHQNPVIWKIGFWWHWHVTSPVIWPVLEAPGRLWRWATWRQVREELADGRVVVARAPWSVRRQVRRGVNGD